MKFLFVILSAICFFYGHSQGYKDPLSKYFFEVKMGVEDPLYHNNRFSKIMINPFAKNTGFGVVRYLGGKNNLGVGLTVYSYTHEKPNTEEVITQLTEENGALSFGDILLNDWAEFRFGGTFYFSQSLSKKFLFSTNVGLGVISNPRLQVLYKYSNNKFVYPLRSRNIRGKYITGELALNYLLWKDHNSYFGIVYEMGYGKSPTEYEVRYGVGTNYNDYISYQYSDVFVAWRHAIKLKLRTDLSIFKL